MSQEKHTPGPWLITARNPKALGIRYITSCVGFISSEIAVIYDGDSRPADVELIAAAPDLLAALHRVIEGTEDTPAAEDSALAQARAAIARAEGQS